MKRRARRSPCSSLFVYFTVYNLLTITLLAMSYGEIAWLVRGRQPRRTGLRPLSHRPGISVLVPAFNEQEVVVTTVSALLEQDYAPLEIVVVDDGSTDATFDRLDAAFDLVSIPIGTGLALQTAALESLHVARRAPALRVVRKANGGRADALNAGLGIARHELVAVTDADSLLEPDALIKALRPFEEQPDECLAVGGSIRVANRSRISHGRVEVARIGRGIEAMQTLEYVRGFLGTRIAWSRLNGLLIVSGAFGLFRRETLIDVGGFLPTTDGRGHGADGAPAPSAATGLAGCVRALRRGRDLLDAGSEHAVGPARPAHALAGRPAGDRRRSTPRCSVASATARPDSSRCRISPSSRRSPRSSSSPAGRWRSSC